MGISFSCGDWAFPMTSHEQALKIISALEFDKVDISLFEGGEHLWPSFEFSSIGQNGRDLARRMRDKGLSPSDVFLQPHLDFVPYAPNHPDEKRRETARTIYLQCLEYASVVGSPHITILPGTYFESDESRDDSHKRCVEELAWRIDQAQGTGITVAVEAHIGSIAPDPQSALRLLQSVPGLTLTLDYTHFTMQGVPDKDVEPLMRHTSHFHARCAKSGRLQVPLEENTIDYARVVEVMRESDYQGCVTLEFIWRDWEQCNQIDTISETVRLRDELHRAAMRQ